MWQVRDGNRRYFFSTVYQTWFLLNYLGVPLGGLTIHSIQFYQNAPSEFYFKIRNGVEFVQNPLLMKCYGRPNCNFSNRCLLWRAKHLPKRYAHTKQEEKRKKKKRKTREIKANVARHKLRLLRCIWVVCSKLSFVNANGKHGTDAENLLANKQTSQHNWNW